MNDFKGIIEDCNKSDLISDKVIKKIIEIIGREEWYELNDENNDVCTTMGELIITLEGITELEKENAELKDDNKVMADNLTKAREIMDFLDSRAIQHTLTRPSYFVEPIKCANCKCPIYLSKKEVKERCLYVVADWTKCLCPSCTDEWKTENGVKL